MFDLSAQLRKHRRKKEMTQEEVAKALGVAPQTVSKWERGETYPDITLLPALANLFEITTDELLGMDVLHERRRVGEVYTHARAYLHQQDWHGAIGVYEEAMHTWPNDAGLMTDYAIALALCGEEKQLARAAELCEQVTNMQANVKLQHTARAALCYIYVKAGDRERALKTSAHLPHRRESREIVQEHLQTENDWNQLLFELSTGEKMK